MSELSLDVPALPVSWSRVRLGDICKTTSGGTPSRKHPEYYEGDIPWVKSGELPDGPVLEIEESISEGAIGNSSAKVFPSGSLLVAMYGATVGKLGILNCDAATNQAVCAIFPPKELEAKFLFWYLRAIRSDLISQAVGGAQPNINQGILRDVSIPLAPLEQQIRIVAEIEKQFSRLDEAVANLKRVKANLKRYKAAVLKAAVEGKLTEKWRQQHPDVEPADKLLERILAERRRVAGKAKYKEPVGPDTSGLPELPARWVWASVEQLGATREQAVLTGPFGSNIGKSDFVESGVPVLTIGCLKESGLTLEKAAFVSEEKATELERYKLNQGDMLFSRMASVGRAGLVTKSFEGALFNYHIMRLRLSQDSVLPMYFVFYVRGSNSVTEYVREVNHGATRDGINTEQLQSLPVALSPLAEQHQIVAEVERRLSIVTEAEAQVEANLRRADRLRQSILKKAFSGQLVPQDANDEPASALLERIWATQPAQTKEPSARQRKHRALAPKKGVPAPKPLPLVAEAPATYCDAIISRILAAMQPGHEYARADLVEPLGLTTGQWNAAIKELKRRGKVQQTGERRWARYILLKG